jgi:hypothetical protein
LDEPAWPTTREEADVLDARARLTRELIELRDAAGGVAATRGEIGVTDDRPHNAESAHFQALSQQLPD